MLRVTIEEYDNSTLYGEPLEFEGESWEDVTCKVLRDLLDSASSVYTMRVMEKWLHGKPYLDKIGSFVVTQYDSAPGYWFTWTCRDLAHPANSVD